MFTTELPGLILVHSEWKLLVECRYSEYSYHQIIIIILDDSVNGRGGREEYCLISEIINYQNPS